MPIPSAERIALNFRRRFKWLFASTDENPSEPLFEIPSLNRYPLDVEQLVSVCVDHSTISYGRADDSPFGQAGDSRAKECLVIARDMIVRLLSTNAQTLCGPEEARMRTQVSIKTPCAAVLYRLSVHLVRYQSC